MKALTIQQPYASLIVLPDDDDRAKRVENRTWGTQWRGQLLIHAGKGKEYLDSCAMIDTKTLPFGAIIGIANMLGCVEDVGPNNRPSIPEWASRRWPWLQGHIHTEGPVCWILGQCRALPKPIKCNGKQGLWEPSQSIIEEAWNQMNLNLHNYVIS